MSHQSSQSNSHTDQPSNRMQWIQMAHEAHTMHDATDPFSQSISTSGDSKLAKCSLCGHPFKREETKVFPFCSVRCQQLDLGLWLDERLGLPIEGHEEQEYTGDENE